MFKCTECGSEYETKPDYCDCGNDEFVITVEKDTIVEKEPQIPASEPIVQQESAHKIQTHSLSKAEFVSLGIFILCLILAIIVVFWPVKQQEIINNTAQNTINAVKEIPPIDKFWDNTVKPLPAIPEPVAIKIVTPPVVKPVQKQTTTAKQKVAQNPKKQTTSTNVTAKATQNAAVNKGTVNKQTAKTTVKTLNLEEEAQKAAEDAAKKYAEVKKAAEDLQTSMAAKQELASYKTRLRNTIGQRIDFTRVVGDGDCAISFRIDSTGKLINGAFAKQSNNITLNNAAYKAFMTSRSYNPPPSGYKGETLTLKVQFYNGNFSISLN